VYVVFLSAPAIGIFHDDGVYLVSAQALAEGRGYRIVSIPWEPVQTKYPILFPWLLSLVWRVNPSFPENLLWLRLVPLGFGLCWGWLSWRLLRRLGMSRAAASLALLLIASSPWVVFLSTTLLAETLFATLITGGLVLIVRIHQGDGRRFDGLAAGALMGASLLARTAGIAPAAAGFISLALRRQWTACALYSAAALVTALPWFWWVAHNASDPGIDPFYSSTSYASWNIIASYSWTEKLAVVGVNAAYIVALGQFWGLTAPVWLAVVVGVVGSALVAKGLWAARSSPVAMLTLASVAMLLAWVWPPVRFLVPLLPLVTGLAFVGGGGRKPLLAVVTIALLVSAGLGLWPLAGAVRQKGGTWFAADGVNDWHAMTEQIEWIDREAPPDAVVVAIHDPTYYLFTGRKALRPFYFDPFLLYYNVWGRPENPFGTTEDFRRRLLTVNAGYIVVTPTDGVARFVTELSAARPGSLQLVNGSPESGFAIYSVDRTRLA
jgi:hypothetical protein